ncbi:MAG: GYD domain-containing protein [Cyanobacteria bacterium P01_G01_bin.54]
MAHYLITSLFKPTDALRSNSDDLQQRSDTVSRELKSQISNVKFGDSYALLDSNETIDFVEADNESDVEKAVEIIRTYGKVQATFTPIISWHDLLVRLKQPANH